MNENAFRPFAATPAAKLVDRRIQELIGRKNQREIAAEIGFARPNILSMIKNGETKVPLDRVPAFAKALEVDPVQFLQLVLQQHYSQGDFLQMINDMADRRRITKNEMNWIKAIRSATGNSDPVLTDDARQALEQTVAAAKIKGGQSAAALADELEQNGS